jgi:prolyl oligopeptidase
VVTHIRGGGEFGPRWHRAALKHKRQRAFDDFIAVGEYLIAEGLAQPDGLGIQGGSNGGALVGAVFTQRPDLWTAVVCEVPLLDFLRYHLLSPGASWIGEYGDPEDPADRAVLSAWSPLQQLRAGVDYPPILLTTSTRDDRVHPGHARRFAARLNELGAPVDYHEKIGGGHGGAADRKARADLEALVFTWLGREFGLGQL